MNVLKNPPLMGTLDYVSDNLYHGYPKQFLDFDTFCQSDIYTSNYKQVDTLVIHNDIIYLIEFKKCDLFYQDIEALMGNKKIKAMNTIKDIIKKAPEKVENCLLVQLPYHLKNYKSNSNIKVKTLYVLGDRNNLPPAKSAGRRRTAKKSSYSRLLREAINKYKGTSYYIDGEIWDKNDFLNSNVYIQGSSNWICP